METLIERACGLDVHKKSVTASLLVSDGRKVKKETRKFGTLTANLVEMREWLTAEGVTHVGMESTGVYWKPVHAILEGHFTLIVGNAHHIKNVPGRKTDMNDAQWLANLVRHGLIRASFVPPPVLRDLRDLTRYRRKLVEAETAERNRVQKFLETANIKLSSVASDIFGVSGRRMLNGLVEGNRTAEEMAEMSVGLLRKKREELKLSLVGRFTDHHRFLLKKQLGRIDGLQRDIAEVEQRIDDVIEPFKSQRDLLCTMPGVDRILAATLIAELGTDMKVFASASHAAAWAGVAPGNNESAGKQKRARAREGNVHLKTALVEAAHGASRTNGTYCQAQFKRLARRGKKVAYVAVGHGLLIAAFHMMSTHSAYRDLGATHFDNLNRGKTERKLVNRLSALGYDVVLNPRMA
jgi:transposase